MGTIAMALSKLSLLRISSLSSSSSRSSINLARCSRSSIQQVQVQVDSPIACEPCNGKGWIVCDFCKGQKTNVKAESNRIYRRCPSCRAGQCSAASIECKYEVAKAFKKFPRSPYAAIVRANPGIHTM